MRLDALTVELRPRSSWEAMELGAALVRRHAAAIWVPWLLVTGAVFTLLNLAAWAIGLHWLVPLLMWWLRPVFDRIPVYVLSRAMFGSVPRVADTVRAQLHWGWRPMLGHLTWRRLSPMRTVMLPIDLLEGADATRLRDRRRIIGAGNGGHAALLTLVCLNFIAALLISGLMLPGLFVPTELLSEAAREVWATLTEDPPAWVLLLLFALEWVAVSLIEPFYIGAGFGLYLNRRTQLEAWDVEIAFRRMRRRLAAATGTALLALVCLAPLAMLPSQARAKDAQEEMTPADVAAGSVEVEQDAKLAKDDGEPSDDTGERTLEQIFGDEKVAYDGFERSVKKAYADPRLRPKRSITTWERKKPVEAAKPGARPDLGWLGAIFAFIAEYGLWLLVAVLVAFLAGTARRWLPWLTDIVRVPVVEPPPVEVRAVDLSEPLPPDIAASARRLWAQGQPRRALALLYRASVEAMVARIDAHLPPGATEAECLRASRRMKEPEDRDAFQRMVRVWQYAAYGHSLPGGDDFESLLDQLVRRFRWSS